MLPGTATLFLLLIGATCAAEVKRVAIIGAGMGGSSTAYFLRSEMGDGVDITVFDRNKTAGGRVMDMTLDMFGREDVRIELGASIYVRVNAFFKGFVEKFGLSATDAESDNLKALLSMGIWNGKEFDFLESPYTLVNYGKALWRWGPSPMRLTSVGGDIVNRFVSWYDEKTPFKRIENFLDACNLSELTNITTSDWLKNKGFSQSFIDELIGGVSHVTYNQEVDEMHALGAMISVAGSGADCFTVNEGNARVAENLLKEAKATVKFETEVTHINLDLEVAEENEVKPTHRKDIHAFVESASDANGAATKFDGNYPAYFGQEEDSSETLYRVKTSDNTMGEVFDAVVIAAPLEFANIVLDKPVSKREYQGVYVTIVHGHLDPEYFGLEDIKQIPQHILVSKGDSKEPFTSIGTKLQLEDGSRVVKFFSRRPMTTEVLNSIFKELVHEPFRTFWYAYPKLKTRSSFPPLKLGTNLYYVNAMESALSTMESEMVAAKNIALLLSDDFNKA